ncbi:hypothetical protein NJB18182_24560 [Mycobacterium montefiorense]|nr:hypothetical protein NJB18182_24560 [Mycobacterium montefiorense]
MRAAFTCSEMNAETITKKIAGTHSDIAAPLHISIRIIDAAAAGPLSTQSQLAPGS